MGERDLVLQCFVYLISTSIESHDGDDATKDSVQHLVAGQNFSALCASDLTLIH
jgi:hypothetical protein